MRVGVELSHELSWVDFSGAAKGAREWSNGDPNEKMPGGRSMAWLLVAPAKWEQRSDACERMSLFAAFSGRVDLAVVDDAGERFFDWLCRMAHAPALRVCWESGLARPLAGASEVERVGMAEAESELAGAAPSGLRWREALGLLAHLGWRPLDPSHPCWRMALAHAAYYGDELAVEALLGQGVPADAASEGSPLPLSEAAAGADHSGAILRLLMSAGACPEQRGPDGFTPMDWIERLALPGQLAAMELYALSRSERLELAGAVSEHGAPGGALRL